MPLVFMQITKACFFQGKTEEFSNVYCLESGVDISDDWRAVAEKIANLEKSIMHEGARWVRYTVWNATGSKNDRIIIDAGDLDGTGTLPDPGVYRECAVLVTWSLPRSPVLKRYRRMSKWIHCIGGGPANIDSAPRGDIQLPQAFRDSIITKYAEPMRDLSSLPAPFNTVEFRNVDGTSPGAPAVHPWIEHRQFHEGKKRKKSATPPAP